MNLVQKPRDSKPKCRPIALSLGALLHFFTYRMRVLHEILNDLSNYPKHDYRGTQGNRTGRKLGHDSDLLCSLQAKFTVAVRIAPRRECTRVLTRSVEETGSNPTSSPRTPAGYAVVAWVTYSSTGSTIIYEKIDKWPRLTRNQLFMLALVGTFPVSRLLGS